jgi:sensor domain CHASE-containing protein
VEGLVTVIVLLIVVAVIVAAFAGLYVWTRRSERDVDYAALTDDTTQTDEQRRAKQVGIGFSSSNIGGTLQ